jgi:hypothetical protein
MHQNSMSSGGFAPGPSGGAQSSPDPLAVQGGGEGKKGAEGREGKGRESRPTGGIASYCSGGGG